MRRRTTLLMSIVPVVAAGAVVLTAPLASAAPGPGLSVDLLAPRHPISADIYGMNFADEALADELNLPVRRWGGNATTRYHYLHDTTNRGSDWYFENVPRDADPTQQLPNGSETDVFVEQDRRTGTDTILTVPLIGWAPKAREWTCGFSIEKYGPQTGNDAQWRPDCGNGVKPDGTFVTGNDPHDTSVEIGPEYIADWLGHLTGKYGTAADGGVRFYNLDNEPDIWHATHRDVHPTGASYDELRDATYSIAAAVKTADPGAKTLGPTGWGWNSLFMSGLDQETCSRLGGSCWGNPPDRAAHGGTPFGDWYLARMQAYETQHGTRILDYFDNHWYPQGSGVAFGHGNDPATNALRLRSTRNLWDPSYVDESWINDETRLIPRMKEMVAANYPGTKTAVTEYNWGALDHINGALAQADVLGIFGREGLDLATLWAPPTADQPGAYAFRMFRNYDGRGSAFGDTSVQATSGDQDKLAIYAAQTPGKPLTMVVVNKTGEELTNDIGVRGGSPGAISAEAWQYSAANTTGISRTDFPIAVAPGCVGCTPYYAVRGTFPANSITTVVVGRSTTTDTVPPTKPGNPEATAWTPTTLTLNWAPSTDNVGVTGYEVVLVEGGRDEVARIVVPGTSHTFTGLGTAWFYNAYITAIDAAGNRSTESAGGPWRLDDDGNDPPTTPGKPTISSVTPVGFTVSWTPSTDDNGVVKYEVWDETGDTFVKLGETTGDTTTLVVTGRTPDTSYSVVVRARDEQGLYSGFSPATPVTTLSTWPTCTVQYNVLSQWPNGFVAEVTVRNPGTTAFRGWTVNWTFPTAGQRISNLWNAAWTPSGGPTVTAKNLAWNANIPPGGTQKFGFIGTYEGTNPPPSPTCIGS